MPKKPTDQITLKPDPANPNRMAPEIKAKLKGSLYEFGDLGSIIFNRRTGLLIGGHQRTEALSGATMEIGDYTPPEPDGTIARGYLVTDAGGRFPLRVVDWDADKAHAAMLAANRYGRIGADDPDALNALLIELQAAGVNLDVAGFSPSEIEKILTEIKEEANTTEPARPKEVKRVQCPRCCLTFEP